MIVQQRAIRVDDCGTVVKRAAAHRTVKFLVAQNDDDTMLSCRLFDWGKVILCEIDRVRLRKGEEFVRLGHSRSGR